MTATLRSRVRAGGCREAFWRSREEEIALVRAQDVAYQEVAVAVVAVLGADSNAEKQ